MDRPRPPPIRKGLPATGFRPSRAGRPTFSPHAQQDIAPIYLYLSLIPILLLIGVGLAGLGLGRLKSRNEERKKRLLEEFGWKEELPVKEEKEEPREGMRNRKQKPVAVKQPQDKPLIVGFWHPYCNAGGGGERVLWTAIAWVQATHPQGRVLSVVYTGDYPESSKEEILHKVKARFDISLDPSSIHFIALPSRHVISDSYWRRFTLLGQSAGSVWLSLQGLVTGKDALWPDIFVDTMGYAFTLPLVSILSGNSVPLGSYIHYPVISTDMLRRVRERRVEGTNQQGISASRWRTWGKLLYYRIFTQFYAIALMFSNVTMTNSSWTQNHISNLLQLGRNSYLSSLLNFDRRPSSPDTDSTNVLDERGAFVHDPPRIVHPPCDTEEFLRLGKLDGRKPVMVSLAQFRPEKDHAKQVEALALLFERHPEWRGRGGRLVLMGSCRNEEDERRIRGLKELADRLGVREYTAFVVNAPFSEIVQRLGEASIGLNTMVDEHFGISVVEFMAAGLIPLAHASAGPLLDIITPTTSGARTGFHGTDASSFADRMHEILSMSPKEQEAIRRAAREKAQEAFARDVFERGWKEAWVRLVEMKVRKR